jgi:Tol biopolymer transport system component
MPRTPRRTQHVHRSLSRITALAFATLATPAALAAPGDVLAPTRWASPGIGGGQSNGVCDLPSISGDGRLVAFQSTSSDLVAIDTNAFSDVFVFDSASGTIELASISAGGGASNGGAWAPHLSSDGRFVCFEGNAHDFVVPNTNGVRNIFVRDRAAGSTELVSVSSLGVAANNTCEMSDISADGRFVAFGSYASNLVPNHTNGLVRDVYVRDRLLQTTVRISVGPGGVQANFGCFDPSISADGGRVAFMSSATSLAGTSAFRNHVYFYDASIGYAQLLSHSSAGIEGDHHSMKPVISEDGQYVVYITSATNILPPPATGNAELCLTELSSGAVERVNVATSGVVGTQAVTYASLSADARYVAFRQTTQTYVPEQSGGAWVRDRATGHTFAVCSRDDGSPPTATTSLSVEISGDGTTVALVAQALVAADTGTGNDVYVRGIGAPATYGHPKQNSLGCLPRIAATGQARISNGLASTVTCTNVINHKVGLLVHGLSGAQKSVLFGGYLYIHGPHSRSALVDSGGNPAPANDCSGVWSFDLGALIAASPIGPMVSAGSVLDLQWWGRDPGYVDPANIQLSDALQVYVAP